MKDNKAFYLRKGNIFAVPIIHYNLEMATQVRLAFKDIQPDCVAVELAETLSLQLLHAASRLPDISIVMTYDNEQTPLYYMCEPCDAAFEGLRSAQESQIPAFCIDLDVDDYPDIHEPLPDPYSIHRIGLKQYYETYRRIANSPPTPADTARETHMARRLKELSLSYDRVLFVGGMAHIERILNMIDQSSFPIHQPAQRVIVELCTLSESSCREVMAEFPFLTEEYENFRQENTILDRQKLILQLYKKAAVQYSESTGNPFPGYNLRNIMKFVRNYAFLNHQLMPNLYQILSAAKGCVDHNYAYEVWKMATEYSYRRNIDNLPELNLTIEDIWGKSKILRFHTKQQSRKSSLFQQRRKDRTQFQFKPPGPFSICSYPPEDVIIEKFGEFLKKKGTQILTEEASRTIPFTTSIEDGIDTRETIRHWHEKKLYIKAKGKPPGGVGSIVIIFDEDSPNLPHHEKYPWKTTWLGEHNQESDMAFFATPMSANVVGPGISRCEYGGFMMSYPPRRLFDIWSDPDYQECQSKAEVLLMAAIDYSPKPLITYVAAKPPRSQIKSFARRFGKKIVFIPIGQLSPITLNKLRSFHVLDNHNKRRIADEYIY